MARFGLIPAEFGGGNIYRLIWSPSRMVTLVGPDKTITVPLYVGPRALDPVGECWLLERWLPPNELYAGTEEQWNADPKMLASGTYPKRGDYVLSEALSCTPSEANIEKLISWIEAGGKRRAIENQLAIQANLEKSLDAKKVVRDEIIRDAMIPYVEAMVGYGGSRGTKTFPILKSAEELGLPFNGGTGVLKRKPVTFEVPQGS